MTIKQIAEKAGTSRGTVDRVLNGRGNVNPELAKRILDIAERERYQPNQLAQALIRSRQRTHIGMVIPSVGNPFFDEVLRGAQSRARKLSSYGTTLTIREIKGYDAATQLQAMRRLVAEGVDALAVMPLDVPEVAEYLQSLPIPVVTVNTDIDVDRVAFVGCDYYNSGMITGDLVQLMLNGRGRVAAVIGSTNVRGHMDRVRGLRTALEGTPEITVDVNILSMLKQAAGDRQILAKQLNISPHQLSYVTHSGEGEGLLFFGNVILPFVDRFPTDLELYRIMTTKLGEVSEGAQK